MAKNSIRDFSATAGSNTDIQSVNIDESCPASGINNAIRELMADLKDVSTGAVNLETPAVDQLNFGDNAKAIFGAGNDLRIYHNGSHSYIDDTGTGNLYIRGDNINFRRYTGDDFAKFISDGAVELYHDNSKKFETTSTGVDVTGRITTDGITEDTSGNVGIGQSSPNQKLDVNGSIVADAYSQGAGAGIFLRRGFESTAQPSITVADHSGSAPDGLSVNGNDGVSFRTSNTERARIDSSGRVLINRTSPSGVNPHSKLHVLADSAVSAVTIQIGNNGYAGFSFLNETGSDVGSIIIGASSTAYNTSSDYRLKENAVDMTGAITRVKSLQPKRFNFIADDSVTVDGFMAHEAQTVVPEAVTGTHNEVDSDGNPVYQGIDQAKLVPLLTGALQEAIAKIETLETEMTALKARVTALEA